jgi:long-chain acyl-CoA synthetase
MDGNMNKNNQYIQKPWLDKYDSHVPKKIEYPQSTINTLLFDAQNKFPKHPFIRYQSKEFTYQFITQKINTLATNLHHIGVSKGDRVAVILPNIPQFIIVYYAILALGGIVVAMNPRYTQTELEFLFNQSGVAYVFCLDSHLNIINSINQKHEIHKIIVTEISDYQYLTKKPTNQNDKLPIKKEFRFLNLISKKLGGIPLENEIVYPNDPAIFQFSGGTTGVPKAAVGLHRNVVANAIQFYKWCNLEEGKEVILAAIPLYHVYGMVLAMNMGVAIGAKIVLISDPTDVDYILEQIEENSVTFYPGVPTMYHVINNYENVKKGKWKLDSIKACISGSFTLHPQIKKEFEQLTDGKLIEGYGLSEAPTATHCNPLYGKNKTGSIGMPLPDVEARIVDLEDGEKVLPSGEVGELIVRGPQVMEGYYMLQEETALAIRNGWLFTGDIARMDEDGYFFLVDRKKSLIKVNGLQVWPNEIEEVINSHPKVKECGIGGIPDKEHGERVVCWIVSEQEYEISIQEIIDWCRQKLVGYKIPSEVIFINKIPRSGVGKILRRTLIAGYKEKKRSD